MTSDLPDPPVEIPPAPPSDDAPVVAPRQPFGLGAGGDTSVLAALVRLIAIVAVLVGAIEAIAGLACAEPRAVALGSAAAIYGLWAASRVDRVAGPEQESTITRIAAVTLAMIGLASVLQPSIASAMAIASLPPAVIVTPIVASRIVLRLLILGGVDAVGQGYLFARPVGAAAIEALLGEGAGLGRAPEAAAEGSAPGPSLRLDSGE